MSKYSIIRKCGHEETIQIYGKISEREGKAEWEATRLCYGCYRAEQDNRRAAASHAAAESAKQSGLPALIGSEKQIAWAETIRKVAIDGISDFRDFIADSIARAKSATGAVPPNAEQAKATAEALFDELLHNASAKFWIENLTAFENNFTCREWLKNTIRARVS